MTKDNVDDVLTLLIDHLLKKLPGCPQLKKMLKQHPSRRKKQAAHYKPCIAVPVARPHSFLYK